MKNPSFEDRPWTDLPAVAETGWLTNQQPAHWKLDIIPIGGSLFGSSDKAGGIPECLHKLSSQLPADEQLGGPKALILHGQTTYKLFHRGAAFGASLSQVVSGLQPGAAGKLIVPIRIHGHQSGEDPYAAESGVWVGGVGKWVPIGTAGNFKWFNHIINFSVPANGAVDVVIRFKSKWPQPVDFFIDNLQFTAVAAAEPEPPTDPEPQPPPAVPYVVVVNLLPQDATQAEKAQVLAAVHDSRQTILQSADDAARLVAPGKPGSRVRVWGHTRWSDDIVVWLQQHGVQEIEIVPFSSSPLAGLKFEQPLDTPWRVTSAFNSPRDYSSFGGKVNDRHEGLDVAPTVSGTSHVLAMYPGKVVKVSSSAGYGNYVITEHTYGGKTFTLWRAHLASVLVSVGQSVTAATRIGVCGSTGNSSGIHDHCTMQAAGIGLAGYIVPNVLDPSPFYPGVASTKLDLLPYLKGDGRAYVVKNANGGQERMQTQNGPNNRFYQTKNSAWEELYHDNDYIYRDRDTSPGSGRFYRLIDTATGQPGSRWIPRHWSPGGEFTQARRVQFYHKSNCQPSAENSGVVTDTMRFMARHGGYTFRTGITLPDVVELLWVNGGEKYFYARGFGLVGWERQHQDSTPAWSAVSATAAAGGSNVREAGCFST